jgi:hypothetical protein
LHRLRTGCSQTGEGSSGIVDLRFAIVELVIFKLQIENLKSQISSVKAARRFVHVPLFPVT